MAADNRFKMSQERYNALKEELQYLETDKAKEVAELINIMKPEYTTPTHFGCVDGAGTTDDDKKFAALISKGTEAVFKLHR